MQNKFNDASVKDIEKARNKKIELSKRYQVPISAIVWMGGDKFAIVINGAMQGVKF